MPRDPNYPVVGWRYRHYKGGEYVVEGFGYYEPKGKVEVCVIYTPVEARHALPWIRPLYGVGGWCTEVKPGVSRFILTTSGVP